MCFTYHLDLYGILLRTDLVCIEYGLSGVLGGYRCGVAHILLPEYKERTTESFAHRIKNAEYWINRMKDNLFGGTYEIYFMER